MRASIELLANPILSTRPGHQLSTFSTTRMHTADELLLSQRLHCVLGFFAGILAHHGAFIHGEWHLRAPHIFLSHAAFISILFTAKWFYSESELGYTISAIATIFHCYLLSLITSIVSYRVLFHRLTRAGFKGPWYAPISKLWHVWAARNGKNYLLLARLHSQYGDFVRTGKRKHSCLLSLCKNIYSAHTDKLV